MSRSTRLAFAIFVLQTAGSGVAVYALPIYIDAFLATNRVDPTSLSLAGTAFFLTGALSGPLFARAAHRLPATLLFGASVLGAGAIVAMGLFPYGPVVVLACAALGVVMSGAFVVIGTALLVRAYDGRATAGMSLATAGTSAGGIVVSPFLALVLTPESPIARNLVLVAAGFLAVATVAVLVVRQTLPEGPPPAPRLPRGHRTPSPLRRQVPLIVGLCLVTASSLGSTAYIVVVGTTRGFAGASLAVLVVTSAAVACRAIGSPGIRLLGLRGWTILSFGLQALGVVLVAVSPAGWVLFVGAALIGQCLGNTILIRSQVIVEIAGVAEFPRRFAELMTCTGLGGSLGPLLLGQLLSRTGDPVVSFLAMAALNLVAVPCLLPWLRARHADDPPAGPAVATLPPP